MTISPAEPGSPLIVIPFRHGPFWNFSYLVACVETREAAVIDPAWDVASILGAAEASGFRITTTLLTHGHGDHAHETEALVAATGARVFAHSAEVPDVRRLYGGPLSDITGDEALRLGKLEMQIWHTPGHSAGSLMLLCEGRLFSGDTLLVGAAGRPGSEPDSVRRLWESIDLRIRPLPPETMVLPGHDSGPERFSTVGRELERVPALRAADFTGFVTALERATGRSLAAAD